MYCRYCGKIIEEDSVYCKNCGANQRTIKDAVTMRKRCKTKTADFLATFFKELFVLALIIIGCILLLAGICIVFNIKEGSDFWVAVVLPPAIIIIGRYSYMLTKWINKNKSRNNEK